MTEPIDNPIINRLEMLLEEVNAAEARLREAVADAHTTSKSLQAERRAFIAQVTEMQANIRENVGMLVQTVLDKHMRLVQETLDEAAKRSIRSMRNAIEMVLEAKRDEMQRMKSIGGTHLGAGQFKQVPVDTDTFPGLKSKD